MVRFQIFISSWWGKPMKTIGIIPARMASTRFPNKPLAPICGIPMIGHIYLRSKMSTSLDDVYIATCDEEIVDYIASIGGKAVMTSNKHERATDRTAEAVKKIEKDTGEVIDVIIMIQGDEPLVTPQIIDALAAPMLADRDLPLANLMGTIDTEKEFEDPNVVKVVVDGRDRALYFSREPIPSRKKYTGTFNRFKQFGIIAFRNSFLQKFNSLTPTELEKIESVDMLRVLEHGYSIQMFQSPGNIYSVDTPEDLRFVETSMLTDPLLKKYQ